MRYGRRSLLAALAAVAAGALGLPAAAGAVTTCNVGTVPGDPTVTMTVTHTSGSGGVLLRVVRVAGSAVVAVLDDGAPVACAGSSSAVGNLEVIRVAAAGGSAPVVIEEPGAFAPGASGNQIGILLEQSGGTISGIVVRDTDGAAERYTVSRIVSGPIDGVYISLSEPPSLQNLAIAFLATVAAPLTLQGGAGADVMSGAGVGAPYSPYHRPLTLIGGGGSDRLTGGDAGDVIDPGPGDDVVDGGAGFDALDYSAAPAGVDVDLTRTGPQPAGPAGADTLTNVEDLIGSPGADVLRGDAVANAIDGRGGDDVIEGRGGNDLLTGGQGADIASFASATIPVTVDAALTTPQQTGGAGLDTLTEPVEGLTGGAAADVLRGTAGPDVIDGGPGPDAITALAGADLLRLRDGAPDTADCGADADRAEVDPGSIDALTACETVVAGVAPSVLPVAGGGGAGGGAGVGTRTVSARLAGALRQKLVKGAVQLRVACPALACSARAGGVATIAARGALKARRVTLTSTTARIGAGTAKTLRLVVPTGRRGLLRTALAARRTVVVRATVVVTDAAAGRRVLQRTITLKR